MRLQGSHVFHVPREAIWACLFDPARLARALPECERFEAIGPQTYALDLRISLPVLRGLYHGTIWVDDSVAPDHFLLRAEAAGPAGRVRGTGRFQFVTLQAHGNASDIITTSSPTSDEWCTLTYDGDVHFSGMLKLLGAQVVSPAARVVIDRFFQRLETNVLAHQRSATAQPADGQTGAVHDT